MSFTRHGKCHFELSGLFGYKVNPIMRITTKSLCILRIYKKVEMCAFDSIKKFPLCLRSEFYYHILSFISRSCFPDSVLGLMSTWKMLLNCSIIELLERLGISIPDNTLRSYLSVTWEIQYKWVNKLKKAKLVFPKSWHISKCKQNRNGSCTEPSEQK